MRAEHRSEYASYITRHPKRVLLAGARARAKKYGITFDLREDDFEIPAICPVLGIPLEQRRGQRGPDDASPTLDRIRPDLGYVRGNVIVVSWRANRLKSDASMVELAQIVAWYQAFQRSRE